MGVLFLQAYYYFEHYPNDWLRIRALVWIVLLVEVSHSVFVTHAMYDLTVTNLNTPANIPKTAILAVLCNTFIDLAFESYCGYRIHVASQRWEFPIACWFFAFARWACNFTAVVIVFVNGFPAFVGGDSGLITGPLLTGVILNVAIASTLTFYTFFGGGGLPRSRPTSRRLMLFIIESGILNCLLMVVMLIASWAKDTKKTLLWLSIHHIVTKLNSNSILITLNSRHNANSDPFSRHTRGRLGNQPRLRPNLSSIMGLGKINVATSKSTVSDGSTLTIGDRSSLASQIEQNEICLLELSKRGPK